LFGLCQYFHQLPGSLLVTGGEKGKGTALGTGTAGTSNTMYVVFYSICTSGHVVIDHYFDIFDIQT
jgi:hypothetical protein